MAETLTALSQRDEAFWVGLALFVLGVLAPETFSLGGVGLSRGLVVVGGGILLTRVLVGGFRILKTTIEAGVGGYREGKQDER
ncbi:hypothetical protein [Halorussus marinus]|uniref:hypothetical protein n=1 Tax=Halorussus marinus TaxID=2505976 RepID=UPI00106E158F|nr:hypothetical protein [Halorussus marinus]